MKKIDSSPALVPANLALYLVRAYYYHNETCTKNSRQKASIPWLKSFQNFVRMIE